MKHTKGPWKYERIECRSFTIGNKQEKGMLWKIVAPEAYDNKCREIGILYYKPMFEEAQANASLIAAAPDLLEACKIASSLLPGPQTHNYHKGPTLNDDLNRIKQAIAKAEGK